MCQARSCSLVNIKGKHMEQLTIIHWIVCKQNSMNLLTMNMICIFSETGV